PMTDANLVRHLRAQTGRGVGLVPFPTVRRGAEAIARELESRDGVVLVDALSDQDLDAIARAVIDLPLVTGGSGLGAALAGGWSERGWLQAAPAPAWAPAGPAVVLAGSCSARTLEQIEQARAAGIPTVAMDVSALLDGADERARIVAAIAGLSSAVVHSSVP